MIDKLFPIIKSPQSSLGSLALSSANRFAEGDNNNDTFDGSLGPVTMDFLASAHPPADGSPAPVTMGLPAGATPGATSAAAPADISRLKTMGL